MNLPPLPLPIVEAYHYNKAQMKAYGQTCYEKALLDAMNATRAFGKTGEVISVIIGALGHEKA